MSKEPQGKVNLFTNTLIMHVLWFLLMRTVDSLEKREKHHPLIYRVYMYTEHSIYLPWYSHSPKHVINQTKLSTTMVIIRQYIN